MPNAIIVDNVEVEINALKVKESSNNTFISSHVKKKLFVTPNIVL